jgi:hypothetical protein
MALTDTAIRGTKPGQKLFKVYDRDGLFLLVNPGGSKLWRWRYRFDGKEKLMALGEYPLVNLGEARELHFAARKTLAAGIDPMAERKAEARPNRGKPKRDCGKLNVASRMSPANGGNGGPLANLRVTRIAGPSYAAVCRRQTRPSPDPRLVSLRGTTFGVLPDRA